MWLLESCNGYKTQWKCLTLALRLLKITIVESIWFARPIRQILPVAFYDQNIWRIFWITIPFSEEQNQRQITLSQDRTDAVPITPVAQQWLEYSRMQSGLIQIKYKKCITYKNNISKQNKKNNLIFHYAIIRNHRFTFSQVLIFIFQTISLISEQNTFCAEIDSSSYE